jgi:hypothetical protein
MYLPIDKKELETIIEILRNVHPTLYTKLWTYKINYLKEKKDGFS